MEGFSSDGSSSFFSSHMPDEFEFPNQTSETGEWSFPECEYFLSTDYLNEGVELTTASGGLTHSQTNQVETSEGSYQTISEGGRAKLTPAQRRENKRQSDYRYRQKQKRTVDELTSENKHLKVENEQLKEHIESLLHNGQLPAAAPERQDGYVSQSTSKQINHQSLLVQDHDGTNSGAADRLSGLEGNELDLQNLNQKIPITVVATNRPIAKLMQKIEADDQSNICFSDFTGLDGDRVKVGKYSFPHSLCPVVKRIITVYGDVSATSNMNLNATEATYILFCASVKEMDDLQLKQVTEDIILKWRDAIRDALRMNFKVDFAMDHLKKIAHAYIGQIESQELEGMSERISELENDLYTRREALAKRKEQSKKYIDAAEEFNGMEVGRLSTENRHLKKEKGVLTIENSHLGEDIRQLQCNSKHLSEVLLRRPYDYSSKGVKIQTRFGYIVQKISQAISHYKRDNLQILRSINFTTQHYLNIEAENSVLRAQVMHLRQRLQSLNEIINSLNESNDASDADQLSS